MQSSHSDKSGPRRSESSRRAILTAAFELAGEVGYTRLSIEGIAARAGVGKQTIYRWWSSKGAVLFDALLMLSENSEGVASLTDSGNLEADLRHVLRATVIEFQNPVYDRVLRALTTEVLHDPQLARAYQEQLEQPMTELKLRRLKSAQSIGQLPPDLDLELAIDLIWSPIFRRWLLRSGPLTEAYADQVLSLALQGLRLSS